MRGGWGRLECVKCGEVFQHTAAFDVHWGGWGGSCSDPAQVGLEKTPDGRWTTPDRAPFWPPANEGE